MFFRRNFVTLSAFLFVVFCAAHAQTPGNGSVTISGSLQGPIYPCGNTSCPTYDSGQVQIAVNGYIATTNYSRNGGLKTSQQLANSLVTQLNGASSPVNATIAKTKITLTSKLAGATSNYPLSTSVTHSSLFPNASFSAIVSGPTLTGGTGGPVAVGTLLKQTSNNTSLCSSSNDPGGNLAYCTAFFDGFYTNSANTSAQTLVPSSPAGRVSSLSVKQLIYPGWNGKLICEYNRGSDSPATREWATTRILPPQLPSKTHS